MYTRFEVVGNLDGEKVKLGIWQAHCLHHDRCAMYWLNGPPVHIKDQAPFECWFTETGLKRFLEENGADSVEDYVKTTRIKTPGLRIQARQRKTRPGKYLWEDENQVVFKKKNLKKNGV